MSKAGATTHIDGDAFSAMREKAAYEPSEASYAELDYLTASEMLERARSLAHSIIPADEAAMQIAYDAMLGARLCRNKQKYHRKSWLSKNRYKRYGPTKALLHENQLVQGFVYRESEKYERYTEGEREKIDNPRIAGMLDEQPLTARDAAIRYLKHLIQNSHDNSANAVLAVTKLIYRYRTVDAAEIFTQLHADGPAENYFSKRKGEFIRKLEDRFRLLIERGVMKAEVGARGERYFKGQDRYDAQWSELIEEYLKLFTPWGTDCPLQEKEESFIGCLFSRLEEIFSEDKRKMSRIHAIVCPDCLRKFMKDMDLPDPRQRLALPMFYMEREGDGQMRKGLPGRPAETAKREAEDFIGFLKREDERRVKASRSSLAKPSLLIDDSEKIPIDSINNGSSRFSFKATSSCLLKLFAKDSEGDLLLATLLIDPNEIKSSLEHKLFGRKAHLVWEGAEKMKSCQNSFHPVIKQV